MLIFDNKAERTRASRILSKFSNKPVPDAVAAAAVAQTSWLSGHTSNFSYILELNMLAGRSFNDLTQYPVFPWVITQYTEPTLDLLNKRTFRDLSCPIGALNPERLSMFQARLRGIPPGEPRFLYGTHYSSPGYVIYFLVREVPDLMLKLQSGKFDAPDRLFQSISRTWNGVMTSAGDVKELTPEFYFDDSLSAGQGCGSFLLNRMGLKLGTRQDGQRVDHVILPPWAASAKAFIQSNRQALESPYVSSRLHCWIDLIFGAKQRGAAAEAADNLFHPLTYSDEIGIKTVSGIHDRRAVEIQIGEFGQVVPSSSSTKNNYI
jgi:factor associated with neutral sphingomyelinase activation